MASRPRFAGDIEHVKDQDVSEVLPCSMERPLTLIRCSAFCSRSAATPAAKAAAAREVRDRSCLVGWNWRQFHLLRAGRSRVCPLGNDTTRSAEREGATGRSKQSLHDENVAARFRVKSCHDLSELAGDYHIGLHTGGKSQCTSSRNMLHSVCPQHSEAALACLCLCLSATMDCVSPRRSMSFKSPSSAGQCACSR